jgi:alanine-glyoxylate transaminase/serine-glyoxylate transaminase/serine-pyruvate transaminase
MARDTTAGSTERLLLGPGPSNLLPAVREALARPLIGHLDPAFLAAVDGIRAQLARLFRCESGFVLPISGTGFAGMECCLFNLLEPGERVLVAVQGVFGERICAIAERAGAIPVALEAEPGTRVPDEDLIAAIERERPQLVALVHAETSTGVRSELEAVARAARAAGALVVVDCVTSLSGIEFRFDDWQIDAAFSGTQKCLNCPPGLSPVAIGARALERIARRRVPVQSWYFDLTLIARYFSGERVYHHTPPISMLFGLGAALDAVFEEGLEARFARHREAQAQLCAGLEALGFRLLVDAPLRLATLTTAIPPYEDEAAMRRRLLERHGIEVGGGIGKLAGRIWRIGLMGQNARPAIVERLLGALREL